MKRLVAMFVLSLAILVSVVGAVSAQAEETETIPTILIDITTGSTIRGDIDRPVVQIIDVRGQAEFPSLIVLDRNFLGEIEESAQLDALR